MLKKAAVALAVSLAVTPVVAKEFSFVALGDMPYGAPEKVYEPFRKLIKEINGRQPDLVVHIGDTKSGGTPCSDKMLNDQRKFMNSFEAPTLYTPGDNEWTDCHRKKAGNFDPVERLGYIRSTYFKNPEMSFGKNKIKVKHQGEEGFPENVRKRHKGVGFITAHIVGSNNNFEPRNIKAVEEFFARNDASTKWMEESFDVFQDTSAIVLAIHADMFEFDFNQFGKEGWLRHSGFKKFGTRLQEKATEYGKPVLLVYGDSHIFQTIRPFPQTAPNLTALEVFGAKDMHAVEISVDTKTPGIFSIAPLFNPAL